VAVALEVVVPPIPSEVILPLAGFLAGRGELGLVSAIAWATVGSLVGALAAYALGAWLGAARVRAVWARIPLAEPADIDRAEAWFVGHADRAVLLGRFIPVVRSLVSIPAGVARMSLPRFVVLTVLGSGVWNAVFVLLGHQLGARWRSVGRYSDVLNAVTITVGVVVVAVAAGRRWSRRRADARG
jgi:membrane protein DedA with SNARE-associated domain